MYDRLPEAVNKLRRDVDQIKRGQRYAHGGSIENAAIQVLDDAGSLRAILGRQDDGTVGVNSVNGPPPPQPTTPTVAPDLGGVTVVWDGQFANAAIVPLDFSRVEVHAAASSGFTPDLTTLKSTIESPQGGTVRIPAAGPVYVLLMARSTSGTPSVASAEVGPYSRAPVVSADLQDGIVTEVKIATDAVTAAKIAAGAVGTTEISDDAVTTPKIIAGAVQAGQIAAGAVLTDKLAAGAVTTAKLDALAVTADKIAANTIVAGNLAAGSVDATALKADAITGKTITGGTITGAVMQTATTGERITINESGSNMVLVYDDTGRAVGELSGRGLLLEGTNGSLLQLDPDSVYPNLMFTNDDHSNAAVINVVETTPGAADIGINSGTFTGSGFTDMKWRTFLGSDFWAAERIRDSDNATAIGGRFALTGTTAQFGYVDTTGGTTTNVFTMLTTSATLTGGRLRVVPAASANAATYVETATGHTGPILQLVNGAAAATRFTVDLAGNTAVGGILTAPNIRTGSVSITPVANTATSTTVTGLALPGTVHRAFVTAQSSAPGTVVECSATSVTADGLTIWVNRTNTTNTNIWYLVIAQ